MSPFAHSPELWLTGHLNRLVQVEKAIQIQAVCRGFLVRRREQKKTNADEIILNVIRNLQPPPPAVTLKEVLLRHGLGVWAAGLPTALEAFQNLEAGKRRQEALWHACICLRLKGQGEFVEELEWADYHERAQVLQELRTPTPDPSDEAHTETLWQRLKKFMG